MADLATIGAILSSVKTATEIAKLLKDSSTSLEQAEVKLKLAELVSALADAKIEVAAIQEALLDKDARIKELEKASLLMESLQWDNSVYWKDSGSDREGPYCPQCFDNNGKLIHLQQFSHQHWRCLTCNNNIFGRGFRAESGQADTSYEPID